MNILKTIFNSFFRTFGRILCYIALGILISFIIGKINVNALTYDTDWNNSDIFGFTNLSDDWSDNPIHYYSRNDNLSANFNGIVKSDITTIFESDNSDNSLQYRRLEGNFTEFIIRLCSNADTMNITYTTSNGNYNNSSLNGGSVDFVYNTEEQCTISYNDSTLIGTKWYVYLYVPIHSISYNPALYPQNVPDSFTMNTLFYLNYNMYASTSYIFYGFSEDIYRASYYPSTVYYTRVNALRQEQGLSPVSREERITESDVTDVVLEDLSWIERVVYNISHLGDTILNGLRTLFIPSDTSFLGNFITTLTSKLGFIAEIPISVINFIINLGTTSWDAFNSITLPSLNIFGYYFWNSQEIDLTTAINLFRPYRYVTDVMCVILCVNTLSKWRETIFGGAN